MTIAKAKLQSTLTIYKIDQSYLQDNGFFHIIIGKGQASTT